jgi:very-short-patch-repair endonuclease
VSGEDELLPLPAGEGWGEGHLLPLPAGEGRGEGHPIKVVRARELRENATRAEKKLWSRLRSRQIAGAKFRRQHPIGSYIVDFFCDEALLAIELDGGGHADAEQKEYDAARTEYLAGQGIRVLRFWNNEVLENTDGVLELILRTLKGPPPSP